MEELMRLCRVKELEIRIRFEGIKLFISIYEECRDYNGTWLGTVEQAGGSLESAAKNMLIELDKRRIRL